MVLVGSTSGAIDFGGPTLPYVGQADAFVAKLSADGQHLWSQAWGSAAIDESYGVTSDSQNATLVVGYHAGTIDFGGGSYASDGGYDAFVVKLAP